MTTANQWFYSRIMGVRPAQAAGVLKVCLGIRRRVVRAGDHAFWIDPVSVLGLKLLRDGSYEPGLTHLLACVLDKGDVFVDVGANEGYFSIIAAALVGSGRVHAVEPQARLRPVIERNIRLNQTNAVTVHRLALLDREGEVDLFLRPSSNTGASSLFRHWRFGSASERVPASTLDALCERSGDSRIRLVKIDCEGAEGLVIAGARRVLSEHRVDFLVVDYHPAIVGREACARAHRTLADAGYTLTRAHDLCIYHLPGLERHLSALAPLGTDCGWEG